MKVTILNLPIWNHRITRENNSVYYIPRENIGLLNVCMNTIVNQCPVEEWIGMTGPVSIVQLCTNELLLDVICHKAENIGHGPNTIGEALSSIDIAFTQVMLNCLPTILFNSARLLQIDF